MAGYLFGVGLGPTADSIDWVGAMFAPDGAEFVNEKEDVTTKSDAIRQVLE
jgi:hypothetical protein